jgi:multiple antibiotic resistance protein
MLYNIVHFLSFTFMAIFPITNPIGMSPIFLSFTRFFSPKERRHIAGRVAINSFFVYWVALIAGSGILSFFSLSIPIVKIAGGIVLFSSAMGMLGSKPKLSDAEQEEALHKEGNIIFFPLTMPVTTGAGSMAMATAIGARIISKDASISQITGQLLGATLGILALTGTIFLCYYFADRIFAKLGKVGTDVVTQLAAFILLAVSIEIIWEGISVLFLTFSR